MADVLVQTRVPQKLGEWIGREAENSGETVAAWLRRLLTKEAAMARVDAWVKGVDRCDPTMMLLNPTLPRYTLERVAYLSGDQAVFSVFDAETGRAVTSPGWQAADWYKKPAEFRFLLAGSPHPWRLLSSTLNGTTNRIEAALAVDHEYGHRYPRSEHLGRTETDTGVAYTAHFYGENEGAAVITVPAEPAVPGRMTLTVEVHRESAINAEDARTKTTAWLKAKGII